MKSKLYLLFLILFFFEQNVSWSQAPNWNWGIGIGESNNETANAVTVDAIGNVIATGLFNGTVDFDPGNGTFNMTSIGFGNIFISKLDATGNFIWAKSIVGSANCWSVITDASGNIYSCGDFYGTADFDPGSGTYNLSTTGDHEIFISKLDSAGNFVWAKSFGGSINASGKSIALDSLRNVYVTGLFDNTVDFDPGVDTFYLTASNYDIFVLKLDNAGNFIWANKIGNSGFDGGASIFVNAADSNKIVLLSSFQGTVDFDPGPGIFNLSSAGQTDISISKFDSAGFFIWAKAIRGTTNGFGESIAVDFSGNIFTTGYFDGTVDFNPDSISNFNLTSAANFDIFISKLDNNGNFIWAKRIGGLGNDYGYSLVPDNSGSVYTSGVFARTVDFDPDSTIVLNITSAGFSDIFICKLDSSGSSQWTKTLGGTDSEYGSSIALDVYDNIYFAGSFESPTIDLGLTTVINADSAAFTTDILIAKLEHLVTGIVVPDFKKDFSIYPNPAIDKITITFSKNYNWIKVKITDINGKIIITSNKSESYLTEINIKDLPEGAYLIQVQTSEFVETKKLVVVK